MKGATFLAVFLIVAGLLLVVIAVRGRAGTLRQTFGL